MHASHPIYSIPYPTHTLQVGGLGFVALLASTEGFEIYKAAMEHESEGDGQLVSLPSGLSYRDIKARGEVVWAGRRDHFGCQG